MTLRKKIMLWLAFIMLIAYIDRMNFAIAAPIIMKEFGLLAGQLGIIMSAFTLGYMVTNFVGGFVVERFKPRLVLTLILLLWSAMVAFTGIAWSFVSLLFIRILFGLFEGPMIPSLTKTVTIWAPPKERGFASGLWMAALPVGVVVGNVLSAVIIEGMGWRACFYMYGAVGIVVAYITWQFIRNNPKEHPSISKQELDYIETSIANHEGEQLSTGSTVLELLKNPWVWVLSFVYFSITLAFWANVNWLPTYLVKVRGSTILKSGFLSALPWVAGALGAFIMGWFSDHFKKSKSTLMAICLFLMAPFTAYGVITPSLTVCIACFCISIFFIMGFLGIVYAVPMELFPRNDVAKASGIMLGCGSFAGVLSPTLVGYIVQYTNSFNAAYYVFAVMAVAGGLVSLLFLARKEASVLEEKGFVNKNNL